LRGVTQFPSRILTATTPKAIRICDRTQLRVYKLSRFTVALVFGVLTYQVALYSAQDPTTAALFSGVIGFIGFWFVPEIFNSPLNWLAMKQLKLVIKGIDSTLVTSFQPANFKEKTWIEIDDAPITVSYK